MSSFETGGTLLCQLAGVLQLLTVLLVPIQTSWERTDSGRDKALRIAKAIHENGARKRVYIVSEVMAKVSLPRATFGTTKGKANNINECFCAFLLALSATESQRVTRITVAGRRCRPGRRTVSSPFTRSGWNVYQFKAVDVVALGRPKAFAELCRHCDGSVAAMIYPLSYDLSFSLEIIPLHPRYSSLVVERNSVQRILKSASFNPDFSGQQ